MYRKTIISVITLISLIFSFPFVVSAIEITRQETPTDKAVENKTAEKDKTVEIEVGKSYEDYFDEKGRAKSDVVRDSYFDFFSAGIPSWQVGPSSLLHLSGLPSITPNSGKATEEFTADVMLSKLQVNAEIDKVDYLSSLRNGGQVYVFTWDNGDGPIFSLDNTKENSVNYWLETLRPKVSPDKFLQIERYIEDKTFENPNFSPVFITDKILANHFNTGEEFYDEVRTDAVLEADPGQRESDACLGTYFPSGPAVDGGRDAVVIEGEYATMLEITPVVPQGFSTLSDSDKAEWKRTHTPMLSKPRLTELGLVLEKASDTGVLDGIKQSGVDQGMNLMTQLKNTTDASTLTGNLTEGYIKLSEENQKGLARGGVFTVTRLVKKVKIVYNGTEVKQDEYKCVPVFSHYKVDSKVLEACKDKQTPDVIGNRCYQKKYKPVYVPTKEIAHTNTDKKQTQGEFMSKDPYAYKFSINITEDWVPTSSYQILAVRCNSDEAKKRIEHAGGTIIQNSDFVVTGVSQVVQGQYAKFFNDLPVSFFYSGEGCAKHMTCTTTPRQAFKDSDGYLNVQNKGSQDGTYGAQLAQVTANRFQLKKDGKGRPLRVDVSVPATIGRFDEYVSPTRVSATLIARRPLDTTQSGRFSLMDGAKEPVFKSQAVSQVLLQGEANKFYVGHLGGGEVAENYKFQFRFYSEPEILAEIPVLLSGEGVVKTEKRGESLLMSCPLVFSEEVNRGIFVENNIKEEIANPIGFKNDATREHLTLTYSDLE